MFCSTDAWPEYVGMETAEAIESATADKDVATIKQVRTKNQQVGVFPSLEKACLASRRWSR